MNGIHVTYLAGIWEFRNVQIYRNFTAYEWQRPTCISLRH